MRKLLGDGHAGHVTPELGVTPLRELVVQDDEVADGLVLRAHAAVELRRQHRCAIRLGKNWMMCQRRP